MDASNLLKPALASGRSVRSARPPTRNTPVFEKDRALVRRSRRSTSRASVPDRSRFLKGLKPYFEEISQASNYTNEAIKAAVELSSRYIHDRKLPDKAIDVSTSSGAAQMLLRRPPKKTSASRRSKPRSRPWRRYRPRP